MYYCDELSMGLAQNGVGDWQRWSEARHRLYWSTVARQVTPPRRKGKVWMRVRRLRGALKKRWLKRVPSDIRVSDEGSRTHPLISEQG